MKTWICNVCGYTHQGTSAPQRCPQCGASASQFHSNAKSSWPLLGVVCVILLAITLLFAIFSCHSATTVDNTPVSSVDLNRYLGKWYEVARLDHRFERNLTECRNEQANSSKIWQQQQLLYKNS